MAFCDFRYVFRNMRRACKIAIKMRRVLCGRSFRDEEYNLRGAGFKYISVGSWSAFARRKRFVFINVKFSHCYGWVITIRIQN